MLDHPADRPHDQPLHREEQQRRGGERDAERDVEDAPALRDHRLAHRPLVQRHLDLAPRPLHGAADHPDDPVAVGGEHPERVAHQRHRIRLAEVEGLVDRRRHRARQHQLAHLVAPEHDVEHPGGLEQLALQRRRHRLVGRREQRQRRHLRQLEPALQIVLAEPRHRRHEDQHLGDHHEQDRQAQEASRKGVEKHAAADPDRLGESMRCPAASQAAPPGGPGHRPTAAARPLSCCRESGRGQGRRSRGRRPFSLDAGPTRNPTMEEAPDEAAASSGASVQDLSSFLRFQPCARQNPPLRRGRAVATHDACAPLRRNGPTPPARRFPSLTVVSSPSPFPGRSRIDFREAPAYGRAFDFGGASARRPGPGRALGPRPGDVR